jgi:uncharacterized protein YnzC (UPF0291/DUF896 family)
MENKKTANNKKEDYYPFSDSLVEKITSSVEKTVHAGWICITRDNNSDSSIENGFSAEIDLKNSFKNIIEEDNLQEKLRHNYTAKFRNLFLKIIEDYLKERYALITDLTDGEKVFVHKISLSITGEGKSKAYNIDVIPNKEIELEKDKLKNIRKKNWCGLDDVANLRTNNNFYNIMFVDIAPTTIRKVRLKLKSGE